MASPSPLSKANTSFCLALFRKLADNDTTANIFYSPFSISSALAMVLLGAGGNTATQMSEVRSSTPFVVFRLEVKVLFKLQQKHLQREHLEASFSECKSVATPWDIMVLQMSVAGAELAPAWRCGSSHI